MVSTEQDPHEVMPRRASWRPISIVSSIPHALGTGWRYGSSISRRSASLPLLLALLVAAVSTSGHAAHIKTLDGARFDLQTPGTFSHLKSGRLQIQTSMFLCQEPTESCINGVAIAYGTSLVRLFIQTNRLVVARGSSDVSSLVVFKATANQNSYRLFLTPDRKSYVDVTVRTGQHGKHLEVNVAITPLIKKQGVDGLLGNGNGNPADDVTNAAEAGRRFKISSTSNLLTCASGSCQFVPLTAADKLASPPVKALQQGFTQIDATKLPVSTFNPN
ncbi:VWD domain-containing protein [Myxococcus sp. Y35]|uniref:VWD domain-containing protein n=1 Tax=Pseudomyxococcus flavus TaxID=3115648 RepID=UPI003CE7A426